MSSKNFLPAEWNKQEATLLAWPHENSDWKPYLLEIEKTYVHLVCTISDYQRVIVLCPTPSAIRPLLKAGNWDNIKLIEIDTNDTWIRDYGPITTLKNGLKYINDFRFDGWDRKYGWDLDDAVNGKLPLEDLFENKYKYMKHDLILEGGNIDVNGQGIMLTALKPWLKKNDQSFHQMVYARRLKKLFGVQKIIWLEEGTIDGDDTGGHIDNLAKFISKEKVIYAQCDDTKYKYYKELKKMEKALHNHFKDEQISLIPFPLPTNIRFENRILPASYINFFFINGAVIVPKFGCEYDSMAMEKFKELVPSKDVIAVDLTVLLRQNGGLHCATQNIF